MGKDSYYNVVLLFRIIIFTIFAGVSGNFCSMWSNARYFDGFCYYIHNTTLNYKDAEVSCEQMDTSGLTRLAEPKADTQYLFLKYMFTSLNLSSSVSGVYLGGIRVNKSSNLIWTSGGGISKWWPVGRPDNVNGEENCLEMRASFDWKFNDVGCSVLNYYVCEKYIDDPCEPILSGSEYYRGSCYKLYNQTMMWTESRKACTADAADLAEPRTISAVRFLVLLMRTTPDQSDQDSYHLGATDEQTEGTFRWLTDGSPVSFDYWGPGEPSSNNRIPSENYMTIKANTKKLNDAAGDLMAKFFCQKTLMEYTYIIVLPQPTLGSAVQVLISGTDRRAVYIVASRRADNCGTEARYGTEFSQVALALEPQKAIDVAPCLGMPSSGIFKQYVRIRSSHELTVLLSARRDSLNTVGVATGIILRTEMLTRNYFLLAVPYTSGQLAVISLAENATEVILKVPIGYRQDAQLGMGGVFLRSPGYATVTLDKYQTVLLDISQLKVGFLYATNPIAAYYYADMSSQEEATLSGYAPEMLIPVELLTSEYVTFPSWPLTDKPERFHILALYNKTFVTVLGAQTQTISLSLSGDVGEITLPGATFHYMKSNVPFQARKTSASEPNGNCVCTLLPSSMWRPDYVYFTPSVNLFTSAKNSTGVTLSSVLFLISESPQFDISYSVTESCLKIEGTNFFGCYFSLPWGISEPIYLTNNGTKFAAYAMWIKDTSIVLTCYPLSMDTSGTYWQNFDGPANINFNDSACDLADRLTTTDTPPASTDETDFTQKATSSLEADAAPSEAEVTSTIPIATTSTAQTDTASTNGSKPGPPACQASFYGCLEQMQNQLLVSYKNTSAYRRLKVSIPDFRVSAVSMGVTGATLLAVFCALLMISDILTVIKCVIVKLCMGKTKLSTDNWESIHNLQSSPVMPMAK